MHTFHIARPFADPKSPIYIQPVSSGITPRGIYAIIRLTLSSAEHATPQRTTDTQAKTNRSAEKAEGAVKYE